MISKHQIAIMDGETEPERRYAHVAVCVEHCLLLFGGAWRDDGQDLQLFPANVIWMYNLYTEQWQQNILPTKEQESPHAMCGSHAEVIESVVYMFGGSKFISYKHTTNALWTLTKTSDGSFAWDEIVITSNMDAPSPRLNHSGWEYSGNLWIFGGRGQSPVGYLNDCGDFDASAGLNNQLLYFNPSCNEWTNPECTGSVPSPRSCCASAIMSHTVWLYGGDIGWRNATDDLLELNMHSLTWTQIQIHEPKPQALYCCSLNVLQTAHLFCTAALNHYQMLVITNSRLQVPHGYLISQHRHGDSINPQKIILVKATKASQVSVVV